MYHVNARKLYKLSLTYYALYYDKLALTKYRPKSKKQQIYIQLISLVTVASNVIYYLTSQEQTINSQVYNFQVV